MSQPLDRKVYGVLHRTKDNAIIPPDEFIVFRVHDKALITTLQSYLLECTRLGADTEHTDAVVELIRRVVGWQDLHPERMKVADVEPGELS